MGWNDHIDDSELANLPPEAYGNIFDTDGPFDPNDHWLETADEDDQKTAMREWFLARYCDPAQETPYNGREGGYLFVNGGPYDPADELPERFSGIVDDELINEVVEDLHGEAGGDEWAPIRNEYSDEEDWLQLEIDSRDAPLLRLKTRTEEARQVLTLTGSPQARELAKLLVFSNGVGALEAFLWETADFWFKNDDTALHDIITNLSKFKDEKIKLGDIFKKQARLREDVLRYLQSIVWHRWREVKLVFKAGLHISLPNFDIFKDALVKRNDIVHRCGHTKDGAIVSLSDAEINDLLCEVEKFCSEVNTLLSSRKNPK